jgi:streptogramin lyase
MSLSLRVAGALLLGAAVAAAPADDRAALRQAQEQARAAYDKKDYAAFLAHSRRSADLAPRSTRALYNLACAQALTGHAKEALGLLDRLARMGLALDPASDSDFASIKDLPEFQALARRFAAAAEPLARATLAFTLSQPDLITEGIAHDPASGDFFVSSVHRRKILRVDGSGVARDFTGEGQDGLMAVMALGVDAPRRALWASTAGVTYMTGFRKEDEGRSFLFEYDVQTGKLRRRLGLPAAVTGGHLSDLTVSPGGDVYVSDPDSGRVYRLAAGEKELRVLVPPGPLGSPQGLALSADGRWLFAADYTQGIARIDPRSGAVTLLGAPEDTALTGIDGLIEVDGGLVGIQNGIRPHRLLKLQLDAAATRIASVSVLERAHPRWDEPTLGVRVGRDLFYVATSQYGAIQKDGTLARDKLQPPVVLRLPLVP